MKQKINYKQDKTGQIGVLDILSGFVNFIGGKSDKIENLEKSGKVAYYETFDKGKVIQKEGKYDK